MNKTTKGALAAGAASVLLLGGAGSLAYWTAEGSVAGGTISSGELKIGEAKCTVWKLDGASAATFDPSASRLVPGDTITKSCTYPITATGDHLSADLAVTAPTASGDLASALTVTGAFTVNDAAATKITSANNGQTLKSTVTVSFPYGTSSKPGNDTQALSSTLSSYVVTATQTHS